VSKRGIEANPEKITAITKMGPIRDLKGVQRVTGCLAALSCFISRLGEKALSLYRLLKKSEHFSWTLETEEALAKLKATLSNSPILVPPTPGEPLLLYVAARPDTDTDTIFKNKGDVQSCTNYRRIKLMSHTMKLWERVIEHCLRRVTSVTQN
jgi:hypothetical protein